MKLSHQVYIKTNSEVVFPSRCVVSGGQTNYFTGVRGAPDGLWGIPKWLLGMTPKLKVPVLENHKDRINALPFRRRLSVFLCVTTLISLAIYFDLSKPYAILLALAATAPLIVYQIINPLELEFRYSNGTYIFEIPNREYAKELAKLNNGIFEDADE